MKEDINYKKLCPEGEEVMDEMAKEVVEEASNAIWKFGYEGFLILGLLAMVAFLIWG